MGVKPRILVTVFEITDKIIDLTLPRGETDKRPKHFHTLNVAGRLIIEKLEKLVSTHSTLLVRIEFKAIH